MMRSLRNILKLKTYIFEYIPILLLSFPPLQWIANKYVLLGHDSGFRLDYLSQLPNLFYSWDPKINYGVDWSMFKGFLITQLPEVLFSFFSNSFATGETMTLIFWFFVMGAGMLLLLQRMFPAPSYRFFRLFTSAFYMYNFYILNGWFIGERAKFSLYAALPIGFLLLFDVFKKNVSMFRNGILFGLLYFVFNGGGVFPLYGASIVVFSITGITLTIVRIREFGWKEIFFSLHVAIAFLIPFLLFNAYYIVPNIYLMLHNYSSALEGQGGIDGLIAWERVISKYASALHVLQMQGLPDWYDNPSHGYALPYLTDKKLIVASFIPALSIGFGLLIFKFKSLTQTQKTFLLLCFFLLPFGLVLTMGTHPPIGVLYELAMKKIPGFAMFRSSFYKFAPAFWFPMIVLSGYYIHKFIFCMRNRIVTTCLGVLLVIGLLIYHKPFFTTSIFSINSTFFTHVQVPNYVTESAKMMKNKLSYEDHILVLPKLDTGYLHLPVDTYQWKYFSLDILPRNAVNRRFIANDTNNPLVVRLYEAVYAQDEKTVQALCTLLHINYVLWRQDVLLSQNELADNPPDHVKSFLDTSNIFSKVQTIGDWSLYAVPTNGDKGVAKAHQKIYIYEGSDDAFAKFYSVRPFSDEEVVVYVQAEETPSFPNSRTYKEAICFMCEKDEFTTLTTSLSLPKQRFTPKSPLFILQKQKEKQWLDQSAHMPTKRIDVDIALMQNYLSYMQETNRQEYENDYLFYLHDSLSQWQLLEDKDRNNYSIRLLAYVSAHKRIVEQSSHSEYLLQNIEQASTLLRSIVWMSESGIYRYTIDVASDGIYTLIDVSQDSSARLTIDGRMYAKDSPIALSRGIHPVEVYQSKETAGRPYVFLEQIIKESPETDEIKISSIYVNPTTYHVSIRNAPSTPFVLSLQEQYNPGWAISLKDARHVRINGYANGWILNKKGEYEITIEYKPQRYFYLGLCVTVFSLLFLCIKMIIRRKITI